MVKGYFIGLGDKTTCGGTVLEGDDSLSWDGLLQAYEGSRVSCGKDGQTYRIHGGVSHIIDNGRRVAGTLDSFSGCPCRARLIPSVFTSSYVNEESPAPQATWATASTASPSVASPLSGVEKGSANDRVPVNARAPLSDTEPVIRPHPQEPGFYVVPKSTTREQLESTLFPSRDPTVLRKFLALNPNLGDVKAGSMIVLSDPNNWQCTREETLLMETAAKVNDALKSLSAQEADFMLRHRDEIETFLAQGSAAIGIGEAMFAKNLEDVKTVLRDIEALHQRTFQANGHLRSPEFFAERKHLLAKLDTHLTAMTRKGIGFPDHPNLKSALGISSRSLVHRWTQAGAAGQIPGYATHIEGVSKAAKVIKYGGWIGTALGGGASYFKVQEVCAAGNTEACEKIKFTETGSFTGGVVGGAIAGSILTGSTVGGLCLALSVPTGGIGTVVCGVVVVGAGSYAGGKLVGAFGESMGEVIYEQSR